MLAKDLEKQICEYMASMELQGQDLLNDGLEICKDVMANPLQ